MTAGTVEKVYRLRDERLTPTMGAILAYYAYRAYYMDGRCAWPSIETVATACFCGTRTAYRAVTRLVELGYMRENPDQSWNARDPETGRLVRRGYRSKVYDVLVENFNRLDDEGQTERARDLEGDTIPGVDDATGTIDADTVGHEAADTAPAGIRDEPDGPAGETCQNGRPHENPTIPTIPETCQNGRPQTGQAEQPCQNGNGALPKWQATNKGLTNSPSVPYGDISPDGGDDATGDDTDGHGDGEAPSAGVGEWDDYRPPEPDAWQTVHDPTAIDATSHDPAGTGHSEDTDAQSGATAILRHLAERQTARGFATSRQTGRDTRAMTGLIARQGAETVLTDLDWALGDPFWAARMTGGRAFARHWTQIHNQRLMDAASRTHAGDTDHERDREATGHAPHRHTWACKHTLAVLGATDPANVDPGQAMQVAIRLNRETGQTTHPDQEETR